MAWIESHQELGHHPKLKKLCRVLNINQPQAVGHLQYLWWWSLDYCEDGDLSRFDSMDVAIGAMWDGDPDEFVNALLTCGWLDSDGDRTSIHDWNDYLGRLLERRRKDAERKRTARSFHGTSSGHPEDGARTAHVTLPYPTVPNPTEQNQKEPPCIPPTPETPGPPGPPGPPGGGKPKTKRATQIPEDWEPDDKGRAFAQGKGMPDAAIDGEVQHFRDHHRARGNTFADISAAWRTWCANHGKWAAARAPTPIRSTRVTPDDLDRFAEELKRETGLA